MFRLGQKIRSKMNWISTVVSNNTDFTRARNHIDVNLTEYLAFCSGYVNIARAYDFIDLWNAFSTICKGCYTLSATNLVYRINASKLGSTQYSRIDAVLLRRCNHNDFFNACNFSWQRSHDNSRRICCCTARNVKANPSQWDHLLTTDDARCIHVYKALLNFTAVKLSDISLRL